MVMQKPVTLTRSISPPPTRQSTQLPAPAAVEAGRAQIDDPVKYFHEHLGAMSRPLIPDVARLRLADWKQMWYDNQAENGRMFVVHQHDHPLAGVHYDLRLQFSRTSALSFSIPYGLPGNPNSQRPNRMAIETRVHCLWNHLVESASHASGSLLIWDTGIYKILPYNPSTAAIETDSSSSETNDETAPPTEQTETETLTSAFKNRHIRLRLHGTKLPKNYTITLRLPSANNQQPPTLQKRKRKRKRKATSKPSQAPAPETSDSDTAFTTTKHKDVVEAAADSDNADSNTEDEEIRKNNAYPGSENTIGSVHQRRWFLTLDKQNSGFVKDRSGRWVPRVDTTGDGNKDDGGEGGGGGWEAFFVRGREVERSVVSGRSARDVMDDEDVEGYVGRKMWRPILE